MQRYFYSSKVDPHVPIQLQEEDLHHLFNVMRAKQGDQFELVDVNKEIYRIEILDCKNKSVPIFKFLGSLDSFSQELPLEITIACGLSKNDKLDWLVQKATELGMAAFQPLRLKRDVVQWTDNKSQQKIERLQKIVKSASEQSKRMMVPKILPIMSLDQWLASEERNKYNHLLYAYEEIAKTGEKGILRTAIESSQPGQKCLILFGSEGGISSEEASKLETAGFRACSLGPRILRAETAPLYALSVISYHYEL